MGEKLSTLTFLKLIDSTNLKVVELSIIGLGRMASSNRLYYKYIIDNKGYKNSPSNIEI